jgi:hypothetical protein
MQVFPLSMPQVNWDTYIKMCQDVLDERPTTSIDEAGLNLKNPDAFLAGLNFDQPAARAMRYGVDAYYHLFFSFIAETDASVITDFLLFTDLKILMKWDAKHRRSLSVMSGALQTWKDAVLRCCSKDCEKQTRYIANSIYLYFIKAGLRDVWHKYTKEALRDDTFILK